MKKAPEKLRFAAVAIDAVIFAFIDEKLHVLVSPVNRPPHYKNVPGFIGGLVDPKETAEGACERIIKEKTNLKEVYTEQLYTFSDIERDKRNRVISVAYLCFVRPNIAKTYVHSEAQFVPVSEIGTLAYDHNEMLQVALERLKGKLSYTTIAQFLLPHHFTLSELQSVYETVLKKEIDKRNFRKKILSLNIIQETGTMQEGVKNRPAALYQFQSNKMNELDMLI